MPTASAQTQSSSSPTRRSVPAIRPRAAAAAAAGIALIVSLLGPTWLHVPANPAHKIPALDLSFGNLRALANSAPAPAEQRAYFQWLGWTLVIITIAVAIAWATAARRVIAIALAGCSLAGLLFTLFAVKGAMTWNQFGHQLQYIRIGGYLLLVAYVATLVSALISTSRRD